MGNPVAIGLRAPCGTHHHHPTLISSLIASAGTIAMAAIGSHLSALLIGVVVAVALITQNPEFP
ncbi:hypothetical protein HMPREF1531_01047 [Propionibacterium sp. oral taxon 192 str. F0372]|uniref:hypothetical protein n=1 Tax=Propionibacterium sp. oral taxon 192 TaxID=671222 RepID=UPI000353B5B2|nr:hypothetical protein [Propionibacterium sp. oral taxon 192]EPH05618.1 hypothetical protein HMPREF1531_01047 [Propionibacterium sp. oral taxon 192 str. F0372]